MNHEARQVSLSPLGERAMVRGEAHRAQSGVALLLFLLMLLALGLLSTKPELLLARLGPKASSDAALQSAGDARDALLGRATTHPDLTADGRGPGLLPCPDLDGDGLGDPPCAQPGQVAIGRLPWRDLGLAPADPPLWYAVASRFGERAASSWPLNSDTSAGELLSLDDGPPRWAALVLMPGPPLAGQQRPGTAPADYLEGDNALGSGAGAGHFVTVATDDGVNDQIVGIGANEVLALAERRVLLEARRLLEAYRRACGQLPWPAPFDPGAQNLVAEAGLEWGLLPLDDALGNGSGPDWGQGCATGIEPAPWLRAEGWDRLLLYVADPCWLPGGGSCTPGLRVDDHGGVGALVVVAGRALPGQLRPSTAPADYFEAANADPEGGRFVSRGDQPFNDQLVEIRP